MGLVNLKSNLTSLKFGKDRFGGGDSGLPYIQTPIEDNGNPLPQLARTGIDAFIRGGFIYAGARSAIDLVRIGKFFTDAPNGPAFIAKQVGLQLTNPRIETGKVGPIENTRIYNLGLNTLAQIGVNAFGLHFNRSGLGPGGDKFYYSTVNPFPLDGSAPQEVTGNRLYQLTQNKIYGDISIGKQKYISTDKNVLIQYFGGPESSLGIGNTVIKRYDNTTVRKSEGITGIDNYSVFSYDDFNKQKNSSFAGRAQDFRKTIPATDSNGTFLTSTDYMSDKINIETRIGIGNPGKPTRNRKSYNSSDLQTQDQINMLPLVNVTNGDFRKAFEGGEQNILGRDLIKFRFESINNDNPNETVAIFFRAFLNGFNDNITETVNSVQYIGRGEKFYTYGGFDRNIIFNFKIAAQSRDEMKPLYQKLNYLMSTLAPDYKGNFMRGNITLLTIGDYIWRQPGILTSLNLSIDDESPWEIALDEPEIGSDKGMYELPHVINASVSFTPIHNFAPRKSSELPFITPSNNLNKWLKPINSKYVPNINKKDNEVN